LLIPFAYLSYLPNSYMIDVFASLDFVLKVPIVLFNSQFKFILANVCVQFYVIFRLIIDCYF